MGKLVFGWMAALLVRRAPSGESIPTLMEGRGRDFLPQLMSLVVLARK